MTAADMKLCGYGLSVPLTELKRSISKTSQSTLEPVSNAFSMTESTPVRAINNLNDVQIILKDLDNFKSRIESQVWNLTGRQIKNGGVATDPNDFVVLKQLGGLDQIKQAILNDLPIPLMRTLLVKDTTVRNDAGDHVIIFGNGGPYSARFFFGVLRKAITVDLTIKVHHKFQGVDTILGTYKIPASQAVDNPVQFTIGTLLQNHAVLTWDILTSDGSADGDGIASFTLVWF
jgi:hypothetical protein